MANLLNKGVLQRANVLCTHCRTRLANSSNENVYAPHMYLPFPFLPYSIYTFSTLPTCYTFHRQGTFQLDRNHPSWINATVVQGDTVRVFGRSLHWDADASETSTKCTSGTTLSYYSPGPTDAKEGAATAATTANPSTELTAGGVTVTTSAANCYEASFPTARIPAGTYTEAVLTTRWGKTSFGLTVLPARPKPAAAPAIINVQADFQGDLLKALAYATSLPTSQRKVLELGSTIYTLTTGTSVPVNTTVKGKLLRLKLRQTVWIRMQTSIC